MWCVEYGIIEEDYIQLVESRGIDVAHEVVQVFGVPFEPKICENGEERAFRETRTSAFPVKARSRGFESKYKSFETGQRGKGSDRRLGWNVPGMRNLFKIKFDDVSGGQKQFL
jgi:hypothetical protein